MQFEILDYWSPPLNSYDIEKVVEAITFISGDWI